MFPVGHGEALAEEIPGAKLVILEEAGHGIDRADWDTVAGAILDHTRIEASSCRARSGGDAGHG